MKHRLAVRGGSRTAATSKMKHFVIIVTTETVNYYPKRAPC